MAWVAVDKDGNEIIWDSEPVRKENYWDIVDSFDNAVELPKGSIKKLIGRDLTWEDDPVELKEEYL